MIDYISKGAILSPDGKYRYMLWREWRGTHDQRNWYWTGFKDGDGKLLGEPRPCVFIMLNPSTANGEIDDPTIRKCVGFCRRWDYEKLIVVNLFAYRATKPIELLRLNDCDEPVGPENAHHIRRALERAGRVVCAWGQHGPHLGQDQTVMGWLDGAGINRLYALGLDRVGRPRHPLMMPYADPPITYNPL